MRTAILILLTLALFSCKENHRFELLDPKRTGIDFINQIKETDSLNVMNFEYIYNGAGVGIADLNNDGWQDLVLAGNQVATRVYLNMGKFRFADISHCLSGLEDGRWYSGVTFVDINSDGWKDIYLTCTAYNDSTIRANKLYLNQGVQENGQLAFVEMAEEYGIADEGYSVHAAFFDYDLDGDLDLFVLNNYINERLFAGYRPKINDGTAPSNDRLYRNNGDGTFSDVSLEAGIIFEGFSLGLALGDVNKDGYTDIYISNDYISNDLLYINQGDGTFRNMIDVYLSYQTRSSMGCDMADLNNDGNPEIFTLDMMPEDYPRKKQTINGFGYIYYINDEKYEYEHQYLRNMLHLHNGFLDGEMLPFSEVGQWMGIYRTEWSWAPLFADYDNDGDKDLFVSNGYPRDMTDKDAILNMSGGWGMMEAPLEMIHTLPSVKVQNYAFENRENLPFKKVSGEWFGEIPSYSYGAAFSDLDNDGDLDLVVNNVNDHAFVYRNNTLETGESKGNYLKIALKGAKDNTCAYGAKVELWSQGNYQYSEYFLSRGYASSMDPLIHFGLSDQEKVDSLKVTWPSGHLVSYLENIRVNQLVEIDIGDAVDTPGLMPGRTGAVHPLFREKEGILEYRHQQDDFNDFIYTQTTIPHKYSQIGPCMQKGDLNGDGFDDIIIGATNTLPTAVFLWNGNRYIKSELEGLTYMKESPESDLAIIDVDLDGDNDVIALSGGYENMEEDYIHYLYVNTNGIFSRSKLPVASFPASVVRPFDFDHDGDLDLFLGARISREIFPFSANSWILINDKGTFSADRSMNFYAGMVTDATWSDLDGDGWEELIIAREWNSITVIKNEEGRRLRALEIPEIESKHGIWYSVTAGDFDLDGDQDLILGNLGNNHRFTVSDSYPLRIYAVDIDLNGTLDPIMSGYWKSREGEMVEYPVNYLDELQNQSLYFVRNFDSYTSFSFATMDDILNAGIRDRVEITLKVNTTASYILWNKGNSFEWESLPDPVQLSPLKKTLVHDFNDDGIPDVIMAGNDHTYDMSTGYYDANKGIVLMSKDGRPFGEVLPPYKSGLLLQGMVEALLYMEGETPLFIAGINRADAKVFTMTGAAE